MALTRAAGPIPAPGLIPSPSGRIWWIRRSLAICAAAGVCQLSGDGGCEGSSPEEDLASKAREALIADFFFRQVGGKGRGPRWAPCKATHKRLLGRTRV